MTTQFTPEQIRRAKRMAWILWNSDAGLAMPEDERITELQQFCFAACGDKELAEKLAQEAIMP